MLFLKKHGPVLVILSLVLSAGIIFTAGTFPERTRTKLGNENFIQTLLPQLSQKKLGLVCNQTSVLSDGRSLIQAVQDSGHPELAVFTPEHGFRGTVEAGEEVRDGIQDKVQVFSLYGKTRKPTREQTEGIGAFVYDIQDVGTRYYTYITTLKYILEAAAEFGKTVYVLDRPNPAGGHIVEGFLLQSRFESFIGAVPIPTRYGLTVGELASMMKGEGWVPPQVDLRVIRMTNWSRRYFWEDTGLLWIPTSPNMPLPETAIIYPGTGLLGALTINQGLGTSNPFLQFGAPWLDTEAVIRKLDAERLFGVALEPVVYTPRSLPGKTLHPPYENRPCQGIRVRIVDKDKFLSLRFTLALIKAIRETHFEHIRLHPSSLNLMFGSDLLERYIEGTLRYEELLEEMEKDEKAFLQMRQKYLLYR